MRPLALLALFASLPALPLAAQDKPDLSGTWNLNAEKSDPPPQMGGQTAPGSRPGGMGGGMGRPTSLFINQMTGSISIELKTPEQSRTITYYLDGRESHNAGMRGQEMVTKSRWDGNSLVTEGENTVNTPMGDMKIKSKEVRTLSDDGKMLTVVSTFTTPRGEMTRKLVYDKQ